MNKRLEGAQRILIVGDSGRGKTTLGKRLSQQLGIPHHETDDIFWKVKFSEKEDPIVMLQKSKKLYANDSWVVDGSTLSLLEPGFDRADIIIHLQFRTLFGQWQSILQRSVARKRMGGYEENVISLLLLLRHVAYKRYRLGYKKHDLTTADHLRPHTDKVIDLYSHKEINRFLNP